MRRLKIKFEAGVTI